MRAFYLITAIVLGLATSLDLAFDPQFGSEDARDRLQLYTFGMGTMMSAWLVTDPELTSEQRPTFDHALLHMVFFPLFSLHQQFRARRWWGVARVVGLVLITQASWLAGIWIALSR